MQMDIQIKENGCVDKEIMVLDTRLPYFYARVRELFGQEPQELCVVLVKDKKSFSSFQGEKTEDCAFSKGNCIYIYEPSQFGVSTPIAREHFYEALYQELIYLFYKVNKGSESS